MGELVGIEGIKPSRRLELMPYGAADTRFRSDVAPADPFNGGANLAGRVGADLKMGLGPNITLDATINPDFGQVEADPAVVNLSAFEVFFDEKRPFFTEGSRLLSGNGPSYFHSRRVGARPACNVSADFVECPPNATILGAAKVTGRLATGMSLGALGAVTSREFARTFDTLANTFGRVEVAPPAGYGVVRVQQEFGASKSVVGVTLTTVQRDLDALLAPTVVHRAYSGGADWILRWDRGAYELRGSLGFSHLRGDQRAINRVQRSPVHFFQRPDARYLTYDSTHDVHRLDRGPVVSQDERRLAVRRPVRLGIAGVRSQRCRPARQHGRTVWLRPHSLPSDKTGALVSELQLVAHDAGRVGLRRRPAISLQRAVRRRHVQEFLESQLVRRLSPPRVRSFGDARRPEYGDATVVELGRSPRQQVRREKLLGRPRLLW
jgi:hypothetical protein